MQQEVEALLALQEDDLKIREIEAQIRELDPKLAEFDKRRDQVLATLARAEVAVAVEERSMPRSVGSAISSPKSRRTSRCRSEIFISSTT